MDFIKVTWLQHTKQKELHLESSFADTWQETVKHVQEQTDK